MSDRADRSSEDAASEASAVRAELRIGLAVLLLTGATCAAFATLAPLSGAVIASGVLKVDSNRKTVQHLEGGIVTRILVRDGDEVQTGDPLVVIESEAVSATVDILAGQLDAERAKAARLEAERDAQADITFPAALTDRVDLASVRDLIASERRYFETKRAALASQERLLQAQMDAVAEERSGLATQTGAEERAIVLLRKELAANESLRASKLVDEVRLLTIQRQIEEYVARRGEHLADSARARQRGAELELKMVNLRDQYRQAAAAELTTTQARIFDLEERLRPSRDALLRQRVLAPIDGTVVGLRVFTEGGVVAPGEALLDIVPRDNPLIVEGRIRVEDIDHVTLGQPADVRLSAYSAQSVRLVEGAVSYVSADRLVDEASGAPYYLCQVRLDAASVAGAGPVTLAPGMPAEVFIKTAERSALDYLLQPLRVSLSRALRDP